MEQTVKENPLLCQSGLPLFEKIEPCHVTPAIDELLRKLDVDFENLEKNLETKISFEETILEVERMQYGLSYAWGVAGHLQGVKNSEELRTAYEKVQPDVIKAMQK